MQNSYLFTIDRRTCIDGMYRCSRWIVISTSVRKRRREREKEKARDRERRDVGVTREAQWRMGKEKEEGSHENR